MASMPSQENIDHETRNKHYCQCRIFGQKVSFSEFEGLKELDSIQRNERMYEERNCQF
jgi:hypothetical protein